MSRSLGEDAEWESKCTTLMMQGIMASCAAFSSDQGLIWIYTSISLFKTISPWSWIERGLVKKIDVSLADKIITGSANIYNILILRQNPFIPALIPTPHSIRQ